MGNKVKAPLAMIRVSYWFIKLMNKGFFYHQLNRSVSDVLSTKGRGICFNKSSICRWRIVSHLCARREYTNVKYVISLLATIATEWLCSYLCAKLLDVALVEVACFVGSMFLILFICSTPREASEQVDGCGDSGDDGVENGERRDPDSIHSGFGRACPLFHHHHGVDAGRVWTRPYCVTGRQFWTEKAVLIR